MAAFATITSRRPNVVTAQSTTARTSSSRRTSPAQPTALPPAAVTAATVSSIASAWMSLTTTAAPAAASHVAQVRPIPEPAPVITTVLPAERHSMRASMTRG